MLAVYFYVTVVIHSGVSTISLVQLWWEREIKGKIGLKIFLSKLIKSELVRSDFLRMLLNLPPREEGGGREEHSSHSLFSLQHLLSGNSQSQSSSLLHSKSKWHYLWKAFSLGKVLREPNRGCVSVVLSPSFIFILGSSHPVEEKSTRKTKQAFIIW